MPSTVSQTSSTVPHHVKDLALAAKGKSRIEWADRDMPVVRQIVSAAGRDNYRFASLVLAIVRSVPFQMRTTGES